MDKRTAEELEKLKLPMAGLAGKISELIEKEGGENNLTLSEVVGAIALVQTVWAGDYRDNMIAANVKQRQAEAAQAEPKTRIISPDQAN